MNYLAEQKYGIQEFETKRLWVAYLNNFKYTIEDQLLTYIGKDLWIETGAEAWSDEYVTGKDVFDSEEEGIRHVIDCCQQKKTRINKKLDKLISSLSEKIK